MSLLKKVGTGAQAGLLAGGVVAVTFFVADLARLAPLATPIALSGRLLGSSGASFDSPVLVGSVAIVSYGGHLAGLTLVHFLAFAILGAIGALVCHAGQIPPNPLTGALLGLIVFSLVFYGVAWLTNAAGVVELPRPSYVLVVNLMAGAVMGGYYRRAARRDRRTTL
jgi:hypothetical protein